MGSVGSRWGDKEKGKWNLELKDGTDGSAIDPQLTFMGIEDGRESVSLDDFAEARTGQPRASRSKRLTTTDGTVVTVTTIYDLLMAQYRCQSRTRR